MGYSLQAVSDFLKNQYNTFHSPKFLGSDPLQKVYLYNQRDDQEIVGVISALLAYGNVTQICKSIDKVVHLIRDVGTTPSGYLSRLSNEPKFCKEMAAHWSQMPGHRFNSGLDLFVLTRCIAATYEQYGSIENHFLKHHQGESVELGMVGLMNDWKAHAKKYKKGRYFEFLLSSPQQGSTCKRLSMYLRWMVRKDSIDPGLWSKKVSAAHLIMPLDTHTGRLSQYLGLSKRKTLNWKTAKEVTEHLKKIDKEDPIRFDFSLCRVGIVDRNTKKNNFKNLMIDHQRAGDSA